GAETGIDACRPEPAHTEAVHAAGSAGNREAQARQAGAGYIAHARWTAGTAATRQPVQARLIVRSLLQAAAHAAADHEIVAARRGGVRHLLGRGRGERQLALGGGRDVHALKTGTRLTLLLAVLRLGLPVRAAPAVGAIAAATGVRRLLGVLTVRAVLSV